MAANRIALNLVTLKNGLAAAALLANLDRAAEAGFDGVGIWVRTIEEWLDSGRSLADLVEEVGGRGLTVEELCPANVLEPDGTVSDERRIFEWARELGAPAVITLYRNTESPIGQAQDDWAEFVRSVEDIGVAPAFEFIGPWPRYNSPLQAWEVIGPGPELGAMVFDTFHFWRGGGNLAEIEQVPTDRIALVHLNDVKDLPRESATDADRTYPGEGIMPLQEIIGRLIRNGFSGALSVEIFGEVQQRDPAEVSMHACGAARRLVAAL